MLSFGRAWTAAVAESASLSADAVGFCVADGSSARSCARRSDLILRRWRLSGHASGKAVMGIPFLSSFRLAASAALFFVSMGYIRAVHAVDTVTYLHTDSQGTPVMESDPFGNVTYTREHKPYGQQAVGAPKNGPGFTGHVQDADTALVYMQARYYDPVSARFLSNDPVPADLGGGQNYARYWYANNNPYRFVDPNGRKPQGQDDPDAPAPENPDRNEEEEAEEEAVRAQAAAARDAINKFMAEHPNQTIPLSAANLGALANEAMLQLTLDQRETASYQNMSLSDFHKAIGKGGGDSQFISWAEESFNVQGLVGPYNGRHQGTDINYMMQGMAWAARGSSRGTTHAAIATYNIKQGLGGEGYRNFKQIPHAKLWADFGRAYYFRSTGR